MSLLVFDWRCDFKMSSAVSTVDGGGGFGIYYLVCYGLLLFCHRNINISNQNPGGFIP